MSAADPVIGREIGSYRIMEMLGQGGMGRVYRAQHPHIGKQVAIKLLKSEISTQPDVVQRFFQEARAVNDIHHENVIDVLDFGKTSEDEYFLLMEFLQGRTLSHALKGEVPFSDKRVGHVGLQICSALAAAHEKGIIHRDLKADNVFLITRAGRKDFVKILDFGIAKLLDDPGQGAKTNTGMVLGTPLYMAPEQALGRPLDSQADVYAMGVLLYQMTTGTFPFFDPNPVALATMHVTAKIPLPSSRFSKINPKLEKVILRCLEKEKVNRYPSMTQVAAELASACGLDAAPYFGLDPSSGWQKALSVKGASPASTALLGRQRRRGRYGVILAAFAVTALVGALGFGVVYPGLADEAPLPGAVADAAASSQGAPPASLPSAASKPLSSPSSNATSLPAVSPPPAPPPPPLRPGEKKDPPPKTGQPAGKKTSPKDPSPVGDGLLPLELSPK